MRRLTAVLQFLLPVGVLVAFALLAWPPAAQAQDKFYTASAEDLQGSPGSIIRWERMPTSPTGADAFRVLYRSTGLSNEPIAVSGVVFVPKDQPPVRERFVVAWAHPTSGIVPRCAPSLAMFMFRQVQGLQEMLERGYIVTATDYPGLGTPGPHPYLVGKSEGRAVLDSVRAARELAGARASRRFAVWGHSQGGQAALFTGLLAQEYAPELQIAGVAAAAPATDLATLLRDDMPTPGGKNLLAMTLWSWSRVFDAPIDGIVDKNAMETVNALAKVCLESIVDIPPRRRAGQALQKRFLAVNDLVDVDPWRGLLADNTAGTLPAAIPVFLAQGQVDDTVPPAVTRAYMDRLCAAGSQVRLRTMPRVGHAFIARDSAAAAIDWMADRFAGEAAPNDCGKR